jgi:hypothetical protein
LKMNVINLIGEPSTVEARIVTRPSSTLSNPWKIHTD